MANPRYDVCIIGGGPGALTALSAVLEPYSLDQLSDGQAARAATALRGSRPRPPRVCVVDPEPWLSTWKSRFKALEIEWLRSPATAHPDAFDAFSLRGFAHSHGREAELYDSGAGRGKGVRSLIEVSSGAWSLPTNALFQDFCDELARRLPHEFFQARATDVGGSDGDFVVELDTGAQLEASAVIMALGVPGPPLMPATLAGLPERLAFHTDWNGGAGLAALAPGERVLVIGGGLSAVQTAQLAHRRGCRVVLASRRPLTTRHFDIDVNWFDRRRTQGHLFGFLDLPAEQRLRMIRETRGGGSVPEMYMEDLRARGASGGLAVVVGEVEVLSCDGAAVQARVGESVRTFDKVVSACGHRPDCTALPILAALHRRWATPLQGGLPVLSHDAQWGGLQRLFVIGALAALQIGPDAGNLMGLRRAAQVVASALDSRGWLRNERSLLGNVRGNRFAALGDDSDGASDSDAESDGDASCEGGAGGKRSAASESTAESGADSDGDASSAGGVRSKRSAASESTACSPSLRALAAPED